MKYTAKLAGAATGASAVLLPLMALAQSPNTGYISSLLSQARGIIGNLIPFLVAVAVVVFIWGVIRYVTAGESEEKRAAGRNLMIYGIIAIFVIVSIWGLVAILQNLTGAGTGSAQTPPIP
ncbi:hypothetical protein CL654_01690 [bacterium]|nr:hypothetical protein [bacterium]|tara:strand:- start:15369 stop:15731 length:363 start_codon:yes stop_codon:yes gene_type:complete